MHIDLLSLHSLTANYSSYTKWFGLDVLAPRLLHWSEFECLKSAVKFANVVKEIDKAHEQEMLKHVI